MEQPVSRVSLTFIKLMVLAAVLYLAVVILFTPAPPSDGSGSIAEVAGVTSVASSSVSSTGSVLSPSMDPQLERQAAAIRDAVPRARSLANIHIGPGDGYAVLGLIPQNGRLEVVGRNEAADWIAIAFTPGSTLYGWVQAALVTGVPDLKALKVVPVTPIRTRQ